MITFQDFLRVIHDDETTNDSYLFNCFGKNAVLSEWWNKKHDGGYSISVMYDTRTHVVYTMEAWDYDNDREYRWIHPGYKEAYFAEFDKTSIGALWSADDREYIDLDVAADILEKAKAMYENQPYDTRVMIEVDLPDETLFGVMKMAHEADLTLNEFVEKILRADIERRQKEQAQAGEQE